MRFPSTSLIVILLLVVPPSFIPASRVGRGGFDSPLPPAPVATPACRVGDFNCDGLIDVQDFAIFKQAFGSADDGDPRYNPLCDINEDHMINGLDFVVFRRAWS